MASKHKVSLSRLIYFITPAQNFKSITATNIFCSSVCVVFEVLLALNIKTVMFSVSCCVIWEIYVSGSEESATG
jgi:hypothetical protein